MPVEFVCPVVTAYLQATREDLSVLEFWDDELLQHLEELKEYAQLAPSDRESQRLRAFFCLHSLYIVLKRRTGGPRLDLPLTREGLNELIRTSEKLRDELAVAVFVDELSPSQMQRNRLVQARESLIVSLLNIIIDAGRFLRPRLRNQEPLGPMGKYYAQGLHVVHTPADSRLAKARELINTSSRGSQ